LTKWTTNSPFPWCHNNTQEQSTHLVTQLTSLRSCLVPCKMSLVQDLHRSLPIWHPCNNPTSPLSHFHSSESQALRFFWLLVMIVRESSQTIWSTFSTILITCQFPPTRNIQHSSISDTPPICIKNPTTPSSTNFLILWTKQLLCEILQPLWGSFPFEVRRKVMAFENLLLLCVCVYTYAQTHNNWQTWG